MADLTNTESNVAAGASAAQTAAGQASQTASNQGSGQADAGAAYRSVGAESVDDIGQAEAWMTNLKSLVERAEKAFERLSRNAEDGDNRRRNSSDDVDSRRKNNSEDFDGSLRTIATQALQNAVTLANVTNNATAASSERVKVIAEALISDAPTFQSAIEAAVAKAVQKMAGKTAA